MSNTTTITEQELRDFKLKVSDIHTQLADEIHELMKKMDYVDSSNFSHNIDRLDLFNDELQEFRTHE